MYKRSSIIISLVIYYYFIKYVLQ